jgi:hypothetical protein
MRKQLVTTALLCIHALSSISAAAAPVRWAIYVDGLPQPNDITDCISEYRVTNSILRVATREGRSLEIIRGENGKVELVTQNGKSYRPIYDESQSLAAFKSLDDGLEHTVLAPSASISPEIEERMRQVIDSVKPCEGVTIPRPRDDQGEVCPPQIYFDGGGFKWYREFGMTSYWERLHRPYFDSAIRSALDRNAQRTCIMRYTACVDACQHAEDMRGYSCMAFGLIYISMPIGAAIGAAACLYGSNRERNRCTASCGAIVECF